MPMRVLIDTTFASRAPLSGTGIYIRRLSEALAELPGVEVIQAANPGRRPPAGGGIGSLRNLSADLRWSGVELPRLARRRHAQLIHHPLPALAPAARIPQVVTVVDLAFERLPHLFDPGFRRFAHFSHRAAARRAGRVVCISETTANDVRELWRLSPGRITVAPLGPGQFPVVPQPLAPRAAEPTHFLYVGDSEPRKNLGVLLDAYNAYRAQAEDPLGLVLAGSAEASAPGVRTVSAPSSEELRDLHLQAAALVHPSLYEGFGLTVVEAMAIGTPVLAASVPGVAEVCADAVRYADPHDPHSFAAGLSELARDRPQREDWARRGRERAEHFSWAACARAHLDAYSWALEL